MKQNKFRGVFFSLVLVGSFTTASAQKKEVQIQKKYTNTKGNPTMVVFKKSSQYNILQAKEILLEQAGIEHTSLRKVKEQNDDLGFVHEKQQQYYKGVKVEFGEYIFHSKNSVVESMSGELFTIQTNDVTPKLSKEAAFEKALAHTGATSYLWEFPEDAKEMGNYKKPEGELVLLPTEIVGKQETRLAYKFDIYATAPISRGDLYIDAKTGEVLFFNATIKHADNVGHVGESHKRHSEHAKENKVNKAVKIVEAALASGTAQTRYSGTRTISTRLDGSSYTLNDNSRKVYTRNANNRSSYISNYSEFRDNDNNWTAAEWKNSKKDDAALDAHWGAMMTYDYFKQKHNRNSYDNNGAQIRSYVHVRSNYDNAFWNGSVMSYGDGSSNGQEGNGAFDALTCLDVAAHEIGHAVCSNTANLAYRKESGAMNEGFSDIWGAAVEHFAKGNGNDMSPSPEVWLIGDEIDRRSGSEALRSMSNPNSQRQPDTYEGRYWKEVNNCTPSRQNDNCGVHTNSGVLNYWFYLLTVGGSGTNDKGNAFSVKGIGMTKAAKIAYRVESKYLSANSKFANARTGAIQAATDLYGANSQEVKSVTNAWHAVGVGERASGGGGNPGGGSYCSSSSNSFSDEYIQRVQLGSIDKTSTGSKYSDFTVVSTNLSKGSSYTVTITPKWSGTAYNEGYSVWIDYNGDGDFEDSGEQVFSKAASKDSSVGGSFIVPSGAKEGKTRMRVSMKYNAIPTPCESSDTFKYGEVEDYSVVIGSVGGSDTQAPSAPANLTASNVGETSVTLSWTSSTDNVRVTAYDIYQDSTKLGSTTSTSANITSLTASTTYRFTVKAKDAAGNESPSSNTVTVTTKGKQISYCGSKGNNSTYEWIDKVEFGGMSNVTGNDGGYKNYTAKAATVQRGTTNKITLSAGFRSSAYNEYWAVYIDFNGDGDFEDAGEKVDDGNSNSSDDLTGDIVIPSTAKLGSTRMRVSMKYKAAQTPCESFGYGEVEDYTVTITDSSVVSLGSETRLAIGEDLRNQEVLDFAIYPNPAKNTIQLKLESRVENTSYRIVNVTGKTVDSGMLQGRTITIGKLQAGVYFLEVNDGQKTQTTQLVKE